VPSFGIADYRHQHFGSSGSPPMELEGAIPICGEGKNRRAAGHL